MNRKHTETVDSKLKTAWQVVSRMYNAEAALHDATITMAHFLLNIDSHSGSYASDIAPHLGMESTSLSRTIQSLEAKKYIRRVADKDDGRRMKIILTGSGKVQKELAKNTVRNFNHLLEIKIGKKRITDFFRIIDEITELADERNKLIKPPAIKMRRPKARVG
jgi:MarR family transcriptional regulator, organic hydroperoxide resistance regulator